MVAFGLGTLVSFGNSPSPWDFIRSSYKIDKNYWKAFLAGKISRQDAKAGEYKTWREAGIKKDKLLLDLKKNMVFIGQAKETFKKIKEQRAIPVILSDSPAVVVDDVAIILGAKHATGNKIFFDKNGYAYETQPSHAGPDGRVSKILALKEFAQLEQVSLPDVAIVTSNPEDIPLFRFVGFSVAFNPQSTELKRAANIAIHSKDLSEVLEYL